MDATCQNNDTTGLPTLLPVEVKRDESGWWLHPGIPDFGENFAAYGAWLAEQGLETTYAMLESDPDHPLYSKWFDDGECDCSSWTPTPPEGDGWFTLSIHDNEDGPVWVWARYTTAPQATTNGDAAQ